MLLELVHKYSNIITSYDVLTYDIAGDNIALVCRLNLLDKSVLLVRYYVLEKLQIKYSFHWQDFSNRLIRRWDNEPHWPDLDSFPHHCHINEVNGSVSVNSSYEAGDLDRVLQVVAAMLLS